MLKFDFIMKDTITERKTFKFISKKFKSPQIKQVK